jgi:proline iminopeptidase
MLPVDGGHELYVHEWGLSSSDTVFLFLHGGPGSGCNDKQKLLFDPNCHRVIFFDQRGSGKSLPHGSLSDNTTEHQITDINKILDYLSIQRVVLVGGSWGSTLALAYALADPERVEALIIRGVFTARESEINYLDKGGVKAFFPDVWAEYQASAPDEYKQDPGKYHGPRMVDGSAEEQKQSAHQYAQLEGGVVQLDDRKSPQDFESFDPSGTVIEQHYIQNGCFLKEGELIRRAHELTMPVFIAQGRYDTVCPPITAYELYNELPNSSLIWTQAGHSGNDRANFEVVRTMISVFARTKKAS